MAEPLDPSPVGGLDDDFLACLNVYPEGTEGRRRIGELLARLNALCRQYGYGAVAQYAAWIEDVWRDPAKGAAFAAYAERRRASFREHPAYRREEEPRG